MKESKIELTHYFHPHDNFYTLRSVHKKCIHQIDFWVEPRFYQPRIHGALNLALHLKTDRAACDLILIVPPVPTEKRMGSLPTEHAI